MPPEGLRHAKRALNICLMWHSVYSANMGVNALTYSTLRYLEEVAERLDVCFDYTILGQGAGDKDGCTDEVVINGKNIPFKFEHLVIPKVYLGRLRSYRVLLKWLIFRCPSFIDDLSQYDLILDVGEGDSFADIYGSARFIQQYLTKVLALAARKTLVLLPQTIGPFNHVVSRVMVNALMRHIRYIYPRDQASLRYLEKAIGNRVFREYLDVAFHLPYEKACFVPEKIHVGLNISALLWHGGYSQDNMFNLQVNYRQVIGEIVRFFLEQEDVLVHLVPHVVLPRNLSLEDDCAVAEEMHREMPETILAPAFQDPIQAKSYISGLDFLVGARMHGCIAAYSSGVPVVPMAYSRKFSGLFVSSLGYPFVADLKHDNQDQVYEKVCNGFENRAALRRAILARRSLVESNIAAFRDELAAIVERVL